MRNEGRKTVYELTTQGQTGIAEASVYFCRVFGEIIRSPPQED